MDAVGTAQPDLEGSCAVDLLVRGEEREPVAGATIRAVLADGDEREVRVVLERP